MGRVQLIKRIERAISVVAALVEQDSCYQPILARLESELAAQSQGRKAA